MSNTKNPPSEAKKIARVGMLFLVCLITLIVRKCSRKPEQQEIAAPTSDVPSPTYTPPTVATHEDTTTSYKRIPDSKINPYNEGYSDGYNEGYELGTYGDYPDYDFSYEGEKQFEADQKARYWKGYADGYRAGYEDGYEEYAE